jgi:hypothetical protein
MQASHGTPTARTHQSLPCTEHVLAELGSIYPTVAYWASAEAGEEEAGEEKAGEEKAAEEEEPSVPAPSEQAEELDELIFAGIVAMR